MDNQNLNCSPTSDFIVILFIQFEFLIFQVFEFSRQKWKFRIECWFWRENSRSNCSVKCSKNWVDIIFLPWFLARKFKMDKLNRGPTTRCLKITEKVSFNIASTASYVYILNRQKLIKNAKNGPYWRVFENLKLAVK